MEPLNLQNVTKYQRIFMVVPNAGTIPSTVKSEIWKKNLYEPLLRVGCDVVLLDYDYDDFFVHAENKFWLKNKSVEFSNILFQSFELNHKKRHFDLCFFYLCDGFVDLNVIKEIQLLGVPVVNYSCNNTHQFHLIKNISQVVDISIFAERDAKQKFDELGVKSLQMQMAANSSFYKPMHLPFVYDISFIGQRYADRGFWLTQLIKNGFDVKIFGPKWLASNSKMGNNSLVEKVDKMLTISKNQNLFFILKFVLNKYIENCRFKKEDHVLSNYVGPILSDSEIIKVINESKINLGFSNVYMNARTGNSLLSHLRLRDFEIPMCGAFYLTGYTDEISEYFEVGTEIEVYRDQYELIDKCKFYLKNEQARKNIAQNALIRSLKCHTWENRFINLFIKIDEIL